MEKKRIIIVGATSGLGLNLARKFLAEGWTVGAAGRNLAALESLKSEAPESVVTAQIDITRADAAEKLRALIDSMGGIDIYFHCSGILRERDPQATVETNVGGFVRMVSEAYDYFSKQKTAGRLVAVSSIAGTRGLADLAVYSASKAFDSTFLEALRQRADRDRLPLRIVDIRPGWTRTPLLDSDKSYLLEMNQDVVCQKIFKAIIHARRTAIIGLRWQILCFFQRHLPEWLWQRLHLPLWRPKSH